MEGELTFEQDFTRHIFSLFGSLYDARASPYIGGIPPEEINEEEDLDVEELPTLDSSLCDFRLKNAYQTEIDNRPERLTALKDKSDIIFQNAENPEFVKEFIIGERLPARSVSGRTSEIEIKKKRLEAVEKSKKAARIRREKMAEQRRQKTQRVVSADREERKEIKKYLEEMKKAEEEAKHERAEEKVKAAEKRKKEMERTRAEEFELMKTAQSAISNISYRSPRKEGMHMTIKEQEDAKRKSLRDNAILKSEARESIKEFNKTNIKPRKEPRNTHEMKLRI